MKLWIIGGVTALALTAFGGVQTWRVSNLKLEVVELKEDLKDATKAVEKCNGIRDTERSSAKTSYDGLQETCQANFETALKSGRVIERFVNAKPNADGSKPMCDATCLRELVGQD